MTVTETRAILVGPETPDARTGPSAQRRRARRLSIVRSISMLTIAIVAAIPLYYVVISAFKTDGDMRQSPLGLPNPITFDNIGAALAQGDIWMAFGNSTMITVGSIAVQLLVGSMAAYAMIIGSGRLTLLIGIVLAIAFAIPLQATLVPQYRLLAGVGLTDSILGVIVLYSSGAVFCYFLIVGYMRTLPVELIEAPRIDGAGPWRIYWTIILPLCRPILITVIVFQVMSIWNDFLIPKVYLSSPANETIILQVYNAVGQFTTNWPLFMATTVIALIPIFLFFVFAQKWIVGGLMAGSVKG